MEQLPKSSSIIDLAERRKARSVKKSQSPQSPLSDLEILITLRKTFGDRLLPGQKYTQLQKEQLLQIDQKGEQAAEKRISTTHQSSETNYGTNKPIIPSSRTLWVVEKIQENKERRHNQRNKTVARVTIGAVALILSTLTLIRACDNHDIPSSLSTHTTETDNINK